MSLIIFLFRKWVNNFIIKALISFKDKFGLIIKKLNNLKMTILYLKLLFI